MKKAKLFMMLALLVMGVSNAFAQYVTVHPGNGSMLPSAKVADGGQAAVQDVFFGWDGFATWKHEQLNLTITTADSDSPELTSTGQMANPANNIFASVDNNNLELGKGMSVGCYVSVTLPKGYRFTGYTIKFSRNIQLPSKRTSGNGGTGGQASFGETTSNFSWYNNATHVTGMEYSANAEEHEITRTAQGEGDMTNVLYFKLENSQNTQSASSRAFISLKYIEFKFTAEDNYTPAIPTGNLNGVSAVDIPFKTSTVTYGRLTDTRYNTGSSSQPNWVNRIAYSSANVKDLDAYLTLYESGSIKDDVTEYDGTTGKGVDYITSGHTIYSEGDYFKLGKANEEQVYYLETPIYVKVPKGTTPETYEKSPIGYRIVGATFEYNDGGSVTKSYDNFKIYNGSNFLGSGYGTYTSNTAPNWFMDEEGYVRCGTNGENYLTVSSSTLYTRRGRDYEQATITYLTTTTDIENAVKFKVNGTRLQVAEGTYMNYYVSYGPQTGYSDNPNWFYYYDTYNFYWRLRNGTSNNPVTVSYNNTQTTISESTGFTQSDFTLKVYDKEGNYVENNGTVTKGQKAIVNSDNKKGTISLTGLNNDAVKFSVTGIGHVKITLTMQALDPYIDRMDIVCSEEGGNGGTLTQQFTAGDFSVRGGQFNFYVPEDFTLPAVFTFKNLYSKYGDNTYYGNTSSTNNSRYSFVWSPYWEDITNVYDTDPTHTYTDKIHTLEAGLIPYTFNNADDVAEKGGIYHENPFNPGLYGEENFGEFKFTQAEMTSNNPKTAYLFTCDETRYNIAPTTATQHTYYAYYEMTIVLHKQDYTPVLTWEPIYDKTFYNDNRTNRQDAQVGLKLNTNKITDDTGTHDGYLTVSQINEKIDEAIKDQIGENVPTSKDQILYIDGSELLNVVENQTKIQQKDSEGNPMTDSDGNPIYETETVDGKTVFKYDTHTYNQLINGLGKNALIYLPYGTSAGYDNFAAKNSPTSSVYDARNNIVIKDLYPFYAKYDVQVDAEKLLKYDRALTPADGYNNIVNATVILPFTIGVTNGVHNPMAANDPGLTSASPFKLSTMNEGAALAKVKSYNYGTESSEHVAYFKPIEGKTSKANVPYVVTIDNVQNGDYNFHVRQKGATVVATPPSVNDNSTTNGIFTGTPSDGTVDGTDYTLTPTGTYMGKIIDKAKSVEPAVFYFSKDLFLTTRTMTAEQSLKIYPFRSFYEYPAPATAKMTSFRIVFGENDEMGGTNGIDEIQRDADLAVIPGSRSITLMARADKNVTIHAVNGQTVDKCNLRAGETRTVSVPAGVYVINGVKMVVK